QLAELHNYVAWKLATDPRPGARDGRLAVANATRACQLTTRARGDYLETLAAAHAEAGRFWPAMAVQLGVLTLSPGDEGAWRRFGLYLARRPFREPPPRDVFAVDQGQGLSARTEDWVIKNPGHPAAPFLLHKTYSEMKKSPHRHAPGNK